MSHKATEVRGGKSIHIGYYSLRLSSAAKVWERSRAVLPRAWQVRSGCQVRTPATAYKPFADCDVSYAWGDASVKSLKEQLKFSNVEFKSYAGECTREPFRYYAEYAFR